jgi:hypothetical protein
MAIATRLRSSNVFSRLPTHKRKTCSNQSEVDF